MPQISGSQTSAGPCSRALLQYLLALRNPSKVRPMRGATQFDLAVVHINEGGAWGQPPADSGAAIDAVRASAHYGTESHDIAFGAVSLEDVFCEAGEAAEEPGGSRSERRQRLADLVQVHLKSWIA